MEGIEGNQSELKIEKNKQAKRKERSEKHQKSFKPKPTRRTESFIQEQIRHKTKKKEVKSKFATLPQNKQHQYAFLFPE